MMFQSFTRRTGRTGLLLLALGVTLTSFGCTAGNVTSDDAAANYIEWQCIAPPDYQVDVSLPFPRWISESVIKNKTKTFDYGNSSQMDVVLEELRVEYRRTDIGTEAPPDLRNATSGSVEIDGELKLKNWFTIVSTEQKSMPPLAHLDNFGFEPETGLTSINVEAELYLHGRTEAGIDVMARATVPIRFCSSNWDASCIEWDGTCQE